MMVGSTETDVVIVGSGAAGLVAAISAARAGFTPVVLEKSEFVGGATSWAFAAIWVPCNDLAMAAGVVDDPEGAASYLRYIGGGENAPERAKILLECASKTLRFLEDVGVSVKLMERMGDILVGKAPGAARGGRMLEPLPIAGSELGDWRDRLRTPPGQAWRVPISVLISSAPSDIPAALGVAAATDQLAQGVALVARLLRAVRTLGIEIHLGAEVVQLLKSEGRVSGVTLKDGSIVRANKAVLLATGSYLSNSALVALLDSLPDYRSMMPDGSDGSGFKLAAELGASVGTTRNNLAINLGYDDPEHPDGPMNSASIQELPRAHVIMVNAQGMRFGNEATFQEYAAALRVYDARPRALRNLPCWMVFDSAYVDQWGFAGSAPGTIPNWVTKASTIPVLADKMTIDVAGLVATVSRFNEYAKTGIDEEFGRTPAWNEPPRSGDNPNASLGSIGKPPFYAVKLRPTLQVGGAGIKTDLAARVLAWSGNPIPGLYAAGDVALHDEFGTGYQAGISLASCMTFACVAIDDMQKS